MNSSYNEFETLIIKAGEGTLSDEDRLRLNELIKSPENQKIYFEMIKVNCALIHLELSESQGQEAGAVKSSFDMDLWQQLAHEEKEAAVVEVAAPKEPEIPALKFQSQKDVRKISKGSLFTLFAAAAAIILIFVFARFAPPATGIKVAVLSDSIHAKWADMNGTMEKGSPLLTSRESLLLREGIVELLFDNQAKVVIEAPAEFELLTGDQIKLQYGRVYAVVPREAIGFTIHTPTARIIDLGTEFGVSADISGDASLYVIRGRTTLIAGEKSSKVSMEVNAGSAKKVSGVTQAVSDIMFRQDAFVREIDSGNNAIWKGQAGINLADMVGGGNGFGTGKQDWAIDPLTGKQTSICKALSSLGQNKYISITWSDFIDGIFTIGAGQNAIPVSSQGHQFMECPDTSGKFWGDIVNGAKIVQHAQNVSYAEFEYQGALQGQIFGTPKDPAIFMEPNMGITFNLDQIRMSLPTGLKISSFGSLCGLCDSDGMIAKSDFWVLVDGKVRDRKIGLQSNDKPLLSSIPLNDNDHFLTLITTDNDHNITRDWCLFARPTLYLEMTQK